MGRQKYTFTVISYVPDYIRNEQINIGIIMFDSSNNIIGFSILPEHTNKLNSLLNYSEDSKRLFKETLKFTKFMLQKLSQPSLFNIEISKKLVTIEGLPENIMLSPLTYGATKNIGSALDMLVDTYVGKEFYYRRNRAVANATEIVKSYFKENNFINNNLLPNPTFKPYATSPVSYKADYAYLNNQKKFSIINSMPSTDEGLAKFYQKIAVLSTRFDEYGDMIFLYDSDDFATEKKQIISDISSTNSRVKSFDITNKSNEFESFKDFSNTTIRNSNRDAVNEYITKNMRYA